MEIELEESWFENVQQRHVRHKGKGAQFEERPAEVGKEKYVKNCYSQEEETRKMNTQFTDYSRGDKKRH